jgi:hypothetical protein
MRGQKPLSLPGPGFLQHKLLEKLEATQIGRLLEDTGLI